MDVFFKEFNKQLNFVEITQYRRLKNINDKIEMMNNLKRSLTSLQEINTSMLKKFGSFLKDQEKVQSEGILSPKKEQDEMKKRKSILIQNDSRLINEVNQSKQCNLILIY
jgi:Txe/YoeB family toxin of Txe-Axe toxin-antitoxin module